MPTPKVVLSPRILAGMTTVLVLLVVLAAPAARGFFARGEPSVPPLIECPDGEPSTATDRPAYCLTYVYEGSHITKTDNTSLLARGRAQALVPGIPDRRFAYLFDTREAFDAHLRRYWAKHLAEQRSIAARSG